MKSVSAGAGTTGGKTSHTITSGQVPAHSHKGRVRGAGGINITALGHHHEGPLHGANNGGFMAPIWNPSGIPDPSTRYYVIPSVNQYIEVFGYSAEGINTGVVYRTAKDPANITVQGDSHDHVLEIDPVGGASSTDIPLEQPYFTVYTYIKG